MINKNRYLYYSILPCCLLLIVIGVYAYGWETPGCDPPGCNLPAPINAGPDPQTKAGNLTIQGNLTTGGFTMSAGAGANKVLTTDASGVASWQTTGGSLWTQIGNDIYYNTGNVGIGTTSPGTAKLKISGGVLDMTSQKITNLATPATSTDAATKGYVDTLDGKSFNGFSTTPLPFCLVYGKPPYVTCDSICAAKGGTCLSVHFGGTICVGSNGGCGCSNSACPPTMDCLCSLPSFVPTYK